MPYSPGPNTVNYNSCAQWGRIVPKFNTTSVGSNGGPSYYGTYDQNGNVREIVTDIGALGGSAIDNLSDLLNSTSTYLNYTGLRNVASFTSDILSSFVDVSDTNNPSHPITGYGSVLYPYKMSQYTVTYCEYLDFLRAMVGGAKEVGTTPGIQDFDQFRLIISEISPGIFQNDMLEGIIINLYVVFDGLPTNIPYCDFDIQPNMSNKPVRNLNLDRAIRYCNWLSNGKPGGQFAGTPRAGSNTTTEDGAYTIPPGMGIIQPTISVPSRNTTNPNNGSSLLYYIPTINEWYKAAYYNGNGSYWTYATQSNSAPSCVISDPNGDGPEVSNYNYNCTVQPSCDKKIVKVYMPGSLLFPNGQRATSLHLRIGNDSTTCCRNKSNIIDLTVPAVTPTRTPTPTTSITPTITPTNSPTPSITPSITPTQSITPTMTVTPTVTQSQRGCVSIDINNNILLNSNFENVIVDGTVNGGGILSDWNQQDIDIHSMSQYDPSQPVKRWIDLNAQSPGWISQTFATTIGDVYRVQFDMGANAGFGVTIPRTLRASILRTDNSILISRNFTFNSPNPNPVTYEDIGWDINSFNFISDSSSLTLKIESLCPECGSNGPVVDNVYVLWCDKPLGVVQSPTPSNSATKTPTPTPTITPTITKTPTVTPSKAPPKLCLDSNTNLNGYTVKVIYEHKAPPLGCSANHACNQGLFDLFIKNQYIGLININNVGGPTDSGPIAGKNTFYRENIYNINQNFIVNTGDTLAVVCRNKYSSTIVGGQSNMTVAASFNVPLALFDTNTIVKFFVKPASSSIVLWNKNYYIVNVLSNNVIQISETKNGPPIVFNVGGYFEYITTGQSSLGYPAPNCHRGVSKLEVYDNTNRLIVSRCIPDGDTISLVC